MDESNEEHRVVPELYFLIAKFLCGGPLKETAKTLLKELESVDVLPRRVDWEGDEHAQSYDEVASQYSDMSWRRLAAVCSRAVQLASQSPSRGLPSTTVDRTIDKVGERLEARLSLLSESLVRPPPLYASHKQDHTLARRLLKRELGGKIGNPPLAMFPPRLLGSLQLQRRTLGHLSAVYCVGFDRRGRYVVTGADDMLVKVWRAVDGCLVCTLRGARAELTDVCVSEDGQLLAAGSVDRLVRVWALADGAPRAALAAHAGTVTSVAWAPPARDIRWLASTSTDCSVCFWACSMAGKALSVPVQFVERMRPGVCHMVCAAWSAGGAFLAAGSADHHVRVYALHGAAPRRVLEVAAHSDAVDSLAWARRGLRFVSGSKDGTAALWTLHATQWRHQVLAPRPDTEDSKRLKMTMVCWDTSDAWVLTAVSDRTIRVWCSRSGQQVRVLRGHRDEAYVLEPHPFLPAVFLSAGHDGQLFIWDALCPEPLARFHNRIEGHGDGALFDAKWGSGTNIAASDSHGHLLLLGLGRGHKLYSELPAELFFHTDYRPVICDGAGGALDEQSGAPPHLLPPPFLVDVEGAPHAPRLQRLVPGREHLSLAQLVPAPAAPVVPAEGGRGVWRGEGVRNTPGEWHHGRAPLPPPRGLVAPPTLSEVEHAHQAAHDMYDFEEAWYRREMRRRPVMISTVGEATGVRRRAGRKRRVAPPPGAARPPPGAARPPHDAPPSPLPSSEHDTSDEWRRHDTSNSNSLELSDTTSESSSSSSSYSDWEGGSALAPPARARRRPRPAPRYSPPVATKRAERTRPAAPRASPGAPRASPGAPSPGTPEAPAPAPPEPEAIRPADWITAVTPKKSPYHPQMGDEVLYFRVGHERYFEAVSQRDMYTVTERDLPWSRGHVPACCAGQVRGLRYTLRGTAVLASVCLATTTEGVPRRLTLRYHDVPDVIDFVVLRHHYERAVRRCWTAGDEFRCVIDDCWWSGRVLDNSAPARADDDTSSWEEIAASHYLALRVRWDNGEVERLSPWDLEPVDPARAPTAPGGAVPVLGPELEALAPPCEWAPGALDALATHIDAVMSLAIAEPFVAPVDLSRYPLYSRVVSYPVDLSLLRARCQARFYRRAAAVQFDARYIATNAERFNEPHSVIVRQARLISDLLLYCISSWENADVVSKYHELAASYRSSDDEPLRSTKVSGGAWRAECTRLLRELSASADAGPFVQPVLPDQAPDYSLIVSHPMDLGTVGTRLEEGRYSSPEQFASDVRLVFSNSRLYNTNKRSRIYSMTVRLSALFEALWSRCSARTSRSTRRTTTRRTTTRRTARRSVHRNGVTNGVDSASSDSETLAVTSLRVHGGAPAPGPGGPGAHQGPARRDSWDSDEPLHVHSKGKGVGKKSKSSSASIEPGPSTSRARSEDNEVYEPPVSANGLRSSCSSTVSSLQALEDELDVYPEQQESAYVRKRRISTDSEPRTRNNHRPHKRTRERAAPSGSSSSSSSAGSGRSGRGEGSGGPGARGAGRYSSDRSYRPRYSSSDDAPLTEYTHHKQRAVKLRVRRSSRRYNEDSEEDSAAAISKRTHHHQHHHHQRLEHRRMLHATQSVRAEQSVRATRNDHDYVTPAHQTNGSAGAGSSSGAGAGTEAGAVSVSSRGRVRKLTAKARGLLRD